jgi:hypothetical protein
MGESWEKNHDQAVKTGRVRGIFEYQTAGYPHIPRLIICQRSEYEGLHSINRFAPSGVSF